jgi:hypothetical protein
MLPVTSIGEIRAGGQAAWRRAPHWWPSIAGRGEGPVASVVKLGTGQTGKDAA